MLCASRQSRTPAEWPACAPGIARDNRFCVSHNRGVSTLADPPFNVSDKNRVGRYAQIRHSSRIRERALFLSPRIPSELELQARWFAGDFGKQFISTNGNKIDIIQFGVWNREAGPDFR